MISNREQQACVVESCEPIKAGHRLIGCTGEGCRGCLPRNAEPGSLVCTACRLRVGDRLTELGLGAVHAADKDADSRTLPSLHAALLQPSRIPSATRGPGGDERPLTLSDDARTAREWIERLLDMWTRELPPIPWGTSQPPNHWLIPPPMIRPVLELRACTYPPRTVPAQTARLLQHLKMLLADPLQADQFVRDIDLAWVEARRRAYPQAPTGHLIGTCPIGRGGGESCGGEVRAIVDSPGEDGWARCRTCKSSADIEWWLALMPPETHEWLPMRALRWHLSLHVGRQISDATIRSLARDPRALPARTVGVVPFAGHVTRHSVGRVEYRVQDAVQLAQLGRRRGRPPRPRLSVEDSVPA